MVYKIDFSKNTFCVITGASRGIGRKIAEEFARRANSVTFLLLARNETGLNETKTLIKQLNSTAIVSTKTIDLSKTKAEDFQRILDDVYRRDVHKSAVIFHNAGQIGNIDKVTNLGNIEAWRNYYNLNMFSVAVLNSVFLQKVNDLAEIFVVNVTSLVGRQAFKYLSMYGSGKAARDMYFKVLALEQPNVAVLNYSPGMVETSMANELVDNIKNYADSEIYAATIENPTKLTTEQTTVKLLSLMEIGGYTSGDIIDYYD